MILPVDNQSDNFLQCVGLGNALIQSNSILFIKSPTFAEKLLVIQLKSPKSKKFFRPKESILFLISVIKVGRVNIIKC